MPVAEFNRRLSIVVDPELYRALATISECTGKPIATVVRGLLLEGLPEIAAGAQAMLKAKQSPRKAAASFVAVVDRQIEELQQQLLPLRRRAGRTPGR